MHYTNLPEKRSTKSISHIILVGLKPKWSKGWTRSQVIKNVHENKYLDCWRLKKKKVLMIIISPVKIPWSLFFGGRGVNSGVKTVASGLGHPSCSRVYVPKHLRIDHYTQCSSKLCNIKLVNSVCISRFTGAVKHTFTCWDKSTFKTNFWFKGKSISCISVLSASYSVSVSCHSN